MQLHICGDNFVAGLSDKMMNSSARLPKKRWISRLITAYLVIKLDNAQIYSISTFIDIAVAKRSFYD